MPDIRLKWQQRLEYIMIDEFQDIDQLQYELMEVLCGYHKNLFIVGDPDQTIYTWRGADVKYLLDFDKKFPGTQTILMMENYRSTPEILAVANSLIDKNRNRIKKELQPTLPCRQLRWSATLRRPRRRRPEWMAGEMQAAPRGGHPLPGYDGALPGPLCDPGGGGGAAGGEDPLHHLQRRPVL